MNNIYVDECVHGACDKPMEFKEPEIRYVESEGNCLAYVDVGLTRSISCKTGSCIRNAADNGRSEKLAIWGQIIVLLTGKHFSANHSRRNLQDVYFTG